MGVHDSDTSLTAPLYISLSKFRLQGKVVVSYEKPFCVIALKNEALKDVTVNSSFDGCSASPVVEEVVRKNLLKCFQQLAQSPIRVRV